MQTIQVDSTEPKEQTLTIYFCHEDIVKNLVPGSNIQAQDTKPINIPYSLMLVDMFYNKILQPFDKMQKYCNNDYIAIIAWKVIYLEYIKNITIDKGITLLLAGVAYENIASYDQDFMDNAIMEIMKFEVGKIDKEDCLFAKIMSESISEDISDFIKTYLQRTEPKYRKDINSYIIQKYKDLATMCIKNVSDVTYHPNFLKNKKKKRRRRRGK